MAFGIREFSGATILLVLVAFGAFADAGRIGAWTPLIALGGSAAVLFALLPLPCVARVAGAWHAMRREGRKGGDRGPGDSIVVMKEFARIYRVEGPAALDAAAAQLGNPVLSRAVRRLVDAPDFTPCRRTFEREARRRRLLAAEARRVFSVATWLLPLATVAILTGAWLVAEADPATSLWLCTGAATTAWVAHGMRRRLLAWLRVCQERDSLWLAGCVLLAERALPTRIEAALMRPRARAQLGAIA